METGTLQLERGLAQSAQEPPRAGLHLSHPRHRCRCGGRQINSPGTRGAPLNDLRHSAQEQVLGSDSARRHCFDALISKCSSCTPEFLSSVENKNQTHTGSKSRDSPKARAEDSACVLPLTGAEPHLATPWTSKMPASCISNKELLIKIHKKLLKLNG